MWLHVTVLLLCLWTRLGCSAINLDGSRAVEPLESLEDAPIEDFDTYHPDQFDCPLPCSDYSNMHSWTPFSSVDRLRRCKRPMMLQFSVGQPLDDSSTTTLIRSCTFGHVEAANGDEKGWSLPQAKALNQKVPNPKTSDSLFEKPIDTAPACIAASIEQKGKLEIAMQIHSGSQQEEATTNLVMGLKEYFASKDNCDESFAFAYFNQSVAGMYVGDGLDKETAISALQAVTDRKAQIQEDGVTIDAVAQLCGSDRPSEETMGIIIDTSGDLAKVQRQLLGWSQGACASLDTSTTAQERTSTHRDEISVSVLVTESQQPELGNSTSPIMTNQTVGPASLTSAKRSIVNRNPLRSRATCKYIEVVQQDDCGKLAKRCKISDADFYKFNPKPKLCSTLMPGDYICCSAGDPYVKPKPPVPKPSADGTCATHLIANGDTCSKVATKYGVTVADLEKWNKAKTWAWTDCPGMKLGYNMCISDGSPPLPPPQAGTECGPIVPNTKKPSNKSIPLSEINPCPLKACCSNWGYCGVFPSHCDIHAKKGGGPGTIETGFQSTCISGCGTAIKKNSGPPAAFQRIGYYESWNLDRECLWLKAKDANADGTYTHIQWAFLEIDPKTWKPVLKDTKKQWADFKQLKNVKRIVSFGGWAYSTEVATYNIIRSAIIDNAAAFADGIANFLKTEGLDGVDIDWEYPGAPDIMVNGKPIGQKGDGAKYLEFLKILKQKVGKDKSVSIAAPASYWYLKAFPIDQIAAVIDYIVYMTYDLHGQWDAGNVNAFDSCPSGMCVRSHINLTETNNAISIITKAGVPNNKIYIGEASYGRSFRLSDPKCYQPQCTFTGTRLQSNANPGRCTKQPGYISLAEINEIIKLGNADTVRTVHDGASNTDVLLYKGDYVSYMTPLTKQTRRENLWKPLNLAGTVDWALDLQSFTSADMESPDPAVGKVGCVYGDDDTVNTANLCLFACTYGFCPKSLCTCFETGVIGTDGDPLPEVVRPDTKNVVAYDRLDVDLNKLCKFACKYGYCPDTVCTILSPAGQLPSGGAIEDPGFGDVLDIVEDLNGQSCYIWENGANRDSTMLMCRNACKQQVDEAEKEGRTTNYGCVGVFPLDKPLPWDSSLGASQPRMVPGKCVCDNMLVNELADSVLEAMPAIAQIGCYIVMSTLKLLLDVGAQFIPGVGKAIDAGLDTVATAAQMASYIYSNDQDPQGAWEWWLAPCGGSKFVPEELKKIFDILSGIADGVTGFKPPRKIGKGSGKKGDDGNPTVRGPGGPSGGKGKGKSNNKPKCAIKAKEVAQRFGDGKQTLRMKSCVKDQTKTTEMIITSVSWAANAQTTNYPRTCSKKWTQACYHYSSAIRVNPSWGILTCPQGHGATSVVRRDLPATAVFRSQHRGAGWMDAQYRAAGAGQKCDVDEYPPAYFLQPSDPAAMFSGVNVQGQLVRWLPHKQNRGAGSGMWGSFCFRAPVQGLSDKEFINLVNAAVPPFKDTVNPNPDLEQTYAAVTMAKKPAFTVGTWEQSASPPKDDGHKENPCWPKGIARRDPGFPLLTYDPYYNGNAPPYQYANPYVRGQNGD